MKNLMKAVALMGFLVAPMGGLSAQLTAGPFVAYHDGADLGVGAFVGFPLEAVHENVKANVSFGYFFPGDGSSFGLDVDYLEVNGDLIYVIPTDGSIQPWVLGGLNIARVSASVDLGGLGSQSASNTEIGLNAGGGVTFPGESFSPFAGAKIELGGGEGFVLFGGLSFPVGG